MNDNKQQNCENADGESRQVERLLGLELADENNPNFDEFRKIHLLFLEKLEKLTKQERACIVRYLRHVSQPFYVVKP